VKASKLAAVKAAADRAEQAAAKARSSDPIEEPSDDCNSEEERWQRHSISLFVSRPGTRRVLMTLDLIGQKRWFFRRLL
jgi:hypothetical protein